MEQLCARVISGLLATCRKSGIIKSLLLSDDLFKDLKRFYDMSAFRALPTATDVYCV